MKKLLIILFILPTIAFSQIKTAINFGINPATGRAGFLNYDTSRTIYYQGPGLYAIGDTVYSSSSGVWSLNGDNEAYYLGYAALGTNDPRSRFEIQTSYNTTSGIDSLGLMLSQSNPATSSQRITSPPFVLEAPAWNTTTSASQPSRFRMYAQGQSGAGGVSPDVYFQTAKDTTNYSTIFRITGSTVIFSAGIQATTGTFSGSVTAAGLNSNSNNMYNTTGVGQNVFGKTALSFPSEPAAIAIMYSNGIQGFLPPVMTMAQRDSFGYTVSAVTMTNGGIGYTSAPNVTNTQTYLNLSAPATNGKQDWGGSFFMGTATISGGAVTGVTITKGGYFNGAVKINFSGGGGTGAAATATMSRLLPDGLTIYCSDCTATDSSTGVLQTWQNSSSTWKNFW